MQSHNPAPCRHNVSLVFLRTAVPQSCSSRTVGLQRVARLAVGDVQEGAESQVDDGVGRRLRWDTHFLKTICIYKSALFFVFIQEVRYAG